jgi:hypothetical protein
METYFFYPQKISHFFPGQLGHLVEVLIIQESVDQFLISILANNPSKSEVVAKMNLTLQREDSSDYIPTLTEEKLEDQLPR